MNDGEHLLKLKQEGATIIFKGLPEGFPGYNHYDHRNEQLQELLNNHQDLLSPVDDLFGDLQNAGIHPETMVNSGIKYIRRDVDGHKIYFLVNHTSSVIDDYLPLSKAASEVIIFDPLTKSMGKAQLRREDNITKVKVKIVPGQTLFLKTGDVSDTKPWNYYEPKEKSYEITGDWKISFAKGGPQLPQDTVTQELGSWVKYGKDAERFSGTANYEIQFEKPDSEASNWMLDLGEVRESAKVWINGNFIGHVWSIPFTILTGDLKKGTNTLTIEVTNLAANRIRALELSGKEWKNFYEINMVDKDYKKFDATKWSPEPSGLLGPVMITPLSLNHSPNE